VLRPRPLAVACVLVGALALVADAAADPGARAGVKRVPPVVVAPVVVKRPTHAQPRPKKPARRAPKLAPGSRGTLAWAIARHTPKVHVPVAEGAMPPAIAGASCPDDMANVDDRTCVDLFEASLGEDLADGATTPWPAFQTPEPARTYRAVSVEGVVPQAYVSGVQAAAACTAAGKRLCQPVEWRHACGGSGKTTYPYGATHAAGKCNDRGKSPMLAFYPQVERGFDLVGAREMNDPRLNQLPGTVAKTGEYADCVNDFGIHDMVGNLHEWTADPNGTFQGGYYLDTSQNGDGCSYRTAAHDFAYHDYSTGFRCCADPTPPSGDE
jgi:formylglycine-generating enzyme